jgi:hydroxymethylglutaryl-CoA reductase
MHIKVVTDNGGFTYEVEERRTAKETLMRLVESMDETGFLIIGEDERCEAIAASTVQKIEVTR